MLRVVRPHPSLLRRTERGTAIPAAYCGETNPAVLKGEEHSSNNGGGRFC